jgi:DNA-binding response OmpR family regulator
MDASDHSQVVGPQAGTRVLIVDDEPDLQRLLTFNLSEAGFSVDAVGTGREGLMAAALHRPSVLILDLMLPDISGTEVCRTLRADPELGDAAILMLTARGDEYDRVLGFEVGADDYVVKPFSVREVVMRVRGLAKRAQERKLARSSAKSEKKLSWRGLELDLVTVSSGFGHWSSSSSLSFWSSRGSCSRGRSCSKRSGESRGT